MELKKVNEVTTKAYAKKDEISKNEVKRFTPAKWLTASAAGLVTLLYTSPSSSIHSIGVVFGCISISEDGTVYASHSTFWHVTNAIMDAFYYVSWVLAVALLLLFGNHLIHRKKYDEERKAKSLNTIKIVAITLVICIIMTALLVVFLKMDLSIFRGKSRGIVTNSLTY